MIDFSKKESYTAQDVLQITALLRDPKDGCPWDKVQTHHTIRKNFLEETYEVLEAIDAEDAHLLCEELGDVLMQVALHTCMEEEQGNFTFADVCTSVCEKLIGRHPHIFSNAKIEDDGLNTWELLKNKEKGRKTLSDELLSVPKPLPALMKTQKTQRRAAAHGAVENSLVVATGQAQQAWASWQGVVQPLQVDDASLQGKTQAQSVQQAAGDLLFAMANQLRLAGVDAEEALAAANARFVAQSLEKSQFSDAK